MSESKTIGFDLIKLAELLRKYRLCKDTTPLNNAGQSCISKSNGDRWLYNLDKIVFTADYASGCIPGKTEEVQVSLSLSICGVLSSQDILRNPLEKLEFNFEIEGYVVKENEEGVIIDELFAAWHLDRHITSEGADDGITKFSHPLYHLAYGGYRMEAKGNAFGISLIMPAPRLLYPPMDAALGIDFLLQNYVEQKNIAKLVIDPDYVRIMKNSQERLWRPFFCSIYSHWNSQHFTTSPDFSPLKLLPLYY
ncbi:hypothetical protein [Chryseolinea soli]|uniref:Uncharacterized protein n=1 Tax=Chryseolinea soli TaxID=2321403 RepID=A0A385SNZ1_9BACT|nr:hypothetical protein [Chryseolinea soli]AYB31987.1 hypothetical protein D4L85_16070 [Chryseolinea soli]